MSWLVPLAAIIIYFESGENIFFTQKRIGKNGKAFKIYKFKLSQSYSQISAKVKYN